MNVPKIQTFARTEPVKTCWEPIVVFATPATKSIVLAKRVLTSTNVLLTTYCVTGDSVVIPQGVSR